MDSNDKNNHISKEQVVIPIEMNLQSIKIDPKPTNFSSKSPEIFEFSPSANKPPKYPTPDSPLTRRKSIKSKARFGEPSVLDTKTLDELGRTSPKFIEKTFSFKQNTPKSIGNSGRATKDNNNQKKLRPDEKEIYKKITSQLTARNRRKMTIKFSFQLFVFLVILACLLSSLLVKKFEGKLFLDVLAWKWFVFVMATFSGMLLTKWFVNFIVFLIEWKFLLKKNVVYFTHGLKDNVVVFIWFAVVLGTWLGLIKPDVKTDKARKVIHYISMTLITLQVASFLWLVKTTMMKILASSFHLNRFFDRIQEAVFQHYVLQTLSGSPVVELARRFTKDESCIGQASLANMGDRKEKKPVDWTKIHQMKQEKIPSWTMKLLVDVVSNSGLSTMSGMLNEGVVEGGVDVDDNQITSEEAAIATAVQIFKNVTGDENACYIKKSDLHRFMIWAEVKVVWPFFEVNENGEIDLKSFCKWVVNVYKDRQALQHALNDNKTAVDELNKMLIGILIILMIVLWLLITEIATTKLLVFLSSQLIVAAFIFGNTCKTTFEAIIFVFAMHPFDVSDRCVIDGQMLIVEEMNILNTVFLRPDKEKVFYPNSVLATKAIGNYYRSPDQGDSLEFGIDYRTSLPKITQLQEQIKLYIEQHPQHWHPSHALIVKEIENVNKIKMVLFFNHTMNFQDYLEKLKRRSVLVLGLKSIFDTLEITYHLLPQEVLLSNIPTMS